MYAFGHFTDQASLDPDIVLASSIAKWEPAMMVMIDAWWDFKTEGTPYAAAAEERSVFDSMVDGGSDITELSASVPEDVVAAVAEAREAILSGELVVPFDDSPFD